MKRIIKTYMMSFVMFLSMNAQEIFKVTASVEKSVFLVGEHAQLAISIKNISTNTISGKSLGWTEVQIFDKMNEKQQYVGPSYNGFGPFAEELIPSGEDYQVIDIHEFFGKSYGPFIVDHYFDIGTYLVKVVYHPLNMKEVSDECVFQVVEPKGEDSTVYCDYVDILRSEIRRSRTTAQAAEALTLLYETHPNSVYVPSVLVQLDAMLDITIKDKVRAWEVRKALVEKFSWSVQGRGMLEGVLKQMKTDTERRDFIKKMQLNSKNSLMKKKYEQQQLIKFEK